MKVYDGDLKLLGFTTAKASICDLWYVMMLSYNGPSRTYDIGHVKDAELGTFESFIYIKANSPSPVYLPDWRRYDPDN
jgi:hypothetical protein